jgi:hypothetical protein
MRLFLFERAQRVVERRHDLAEGLFELVEFVDLASGVAQEAAQCLVLLTDARADVGQGLGGVGFVGARAADVFAFSTEYVRQFRHDKAPDP